MIYAVYVVLNKQGRIIDYGIHKKNTLDSYDPLVKKIQNSNNGAEAIEVVSEVEGKPIASRILEATRVVLDIVNREGAGFKKPADTSNKNHTKICYLISLISMCIGIKEGNQQAIDYYSSFVKQFRTLLEVLEVPASEIPTEDKLAHSSTDELREYITTTILESTKRGLQVVDPRPYDEVFGEYNPDEEVGTEEASTTKEEDSIGSEAEEEYEEVEESSEYTEKEEAYEEGEEKQAPKEEQSIEEWTTRKEVEFVKFRCGYIWHKRKENEEKAAEFLRRSNACKKELVNKKARTYKHMTSQETMISRLSVQQLKERYMEALAVLKLPKVYNEEELASEAYRKQKNLEDRIDALREGVLIERAKNGDSQKLYDLQVKLRIAKVNLQKIVGVEMKHKPRGT
jgi:hypothetical protein